jgi:hypothetical protein
LPGIVALLNWTYSSDVEEQRKAAMADAPNAAASGTFKLGELEINRLGFGTMQLTGPGV